MLPRALPLAALLALCLAGTAAAAPTVVTVTVKDDPVGATCSGSGACSLRAAIETAPVPADLQVVLPAGTYTVTRGEIAVGGTNVAVVGAGARTTTIDAGGLSRIFNATPSNQLTVSDVTLTGGLADLGPGAPAAGDGDGGAIFAGAALNLRRTVFRGNVARISGGAIANRGPENMLSSGDVFTVVDSTFTDNHVRGGAGEGEGGAIASFSNLFLTNSTVTGNSSENPGLNQGGGVVSAFSTATLVNSTIAGNDAAPASAAVVGPVASQGGGLSGDTVQNLVGPAGAIVATNTIIAGNTVGTTPQDCALVATTSDHNLSGDATCGFTDAASRQNADPLLAALADNGGPTPTRLIGAGSPARDAGVAVAAPAMGTTPPATPTVDQRGQLRPVGTALDIGAVELALPTAVTGAATDVGRSTATVAGTAGNPSTIAAATTQVEFGTTTAYGQTAPGAGVPTATATRAVSAGLTDLAPSTTYHYRVVATNGDGVARGTDATFTTAAAPGTPATAPGAASSPAPTMTMTPPLPPRTCTSRRSITLHVSGARRGSVRATRAGKALEVTERDGEATVAIPLRGLKRGSYTIVVTGRSARTGRPVRLTRTYRTCRTPSESKPG